MNAIKAVFDAKKAEVGVFTRSDVLPLIVRVFAREAAR